MAYQNDDGSNTEPTPEGEPDVEHNEDGSVTVKTAPPPPEMPDEAFNLVPFLGQDEKGKKFLTDLAKKTLDDVKEDWDSCEGYREKRKQRFKLMTGDLGQKAYPFEDCANVHVPVMLERSLRIVHRLYAEMFPDRDFIFNAVPTTSKEESRERAEIVTLHTNSQLRKETPDFFRQNRRGLMEFVVNGDVIFYSYRDIPGKRNKHEALNCEEVVIPYHWKSTQVDLSDIPRKTRVVRKYKHELLGLERDGVYSGVEEIFEKYKDSSFQKGPELTVRQAVDKLDGREAPTTTRGSNAYYLLYEHHAWCKLPGEEIDKPVVITVEECTSTIVGLFVREQEDWKDRARFDAQVKELQDFQQLNGQHQQAAAATQQAHDRLQQPDVPPDEAQALMGAMSHDDLTPPIPPTWLEKSADGQPDPVRKIPIEYFSHGVCIENIDGSMGLGVGMLLQPFNELANSLSNQFIDSATLANVSTSIGPWNVETEAGEFVLKPGQHHRLKGVSAENIDKAIKFIQFPQANPQMIEMVKMALESADGVSSAPDVLSGEAGKANETYRGIATRVEQATKQLTVLALNYLEMLSNVMRNHARLNAVFMDDVEIKSVVDPRTLESKDLTIGRGLYNEDFDIAFTADTRFTGKQQRIQEADDVVAMIAQALPPPMVQLMFSPTFVYQALAESLKARGKHSMIQFLPKPPDGASWPGAGGPPPGGQGGPPPGGQQPGGAPPPGAPTSQGPDGQPVQGPPAPPPPQ